MLRPLFLVTTTGFWLTMMGLLFQREFFELTPVQAPYEILPLHDLHEREEYRAVYSGKDRIGFGFVALETISKPPEEGYELRHQNYLSFIFLGKEREMLVKGTARLDRQLNLKSFEVRVSSGDYWSKLSGQISKNVLNLVIEGKEGEPIQRTLPVEGPVIFSESLPFIWTPENLKIGKRGRLRLWNPLLLNFQDIEFRVTGKDKLVYQGKETATFVATLNQGGIENRVWISPESVVLQEETPMGLLVKKEEAWQIFDAMRQKQATPPALPNLYSIPSNQILKDPLSLSGLKIKIKTPEEEQILEITRDDFRGLESIPLPVPVNPLAFAPFLETTAWIQTKDPAIAQKAREIAGTEKSALTAALKIMDWVHENVSPVPTLGIPSARQVLAVKKGDCNEYTTLFTALARAAGIPTKMIAGLVYQNGRFFYHAWAEIYAGRWVGVDPTFGEAPINATHIPLVEGNLEEQIALINKLGKIKIWILETRP